MTDKRLSGDLDYREQYRLALQHAREAAEDVVKRDERIAALEASLAQVTKELAELHREHKAGWEERDQLKASSRVLSELLQGRKKDAEEARALAEKFRVLIQKTYDADFFKHLDECKVKFHKGSPPTGCTCDLSEISGEIREALSASREEGK